MRSGEIVQANNFKVQTSVSIVPNGLKVTINFITMNTIIIICLYRFITVTLRYKPQQNCSSRYENAYIRGRYIF